MATNWTMTVDCARPAALAKLWSLALGYETAPTSVDPEGKLPSISFMRVPEPKTAKNRMHIDIHVDGDRLTAAGATVVKQYDVQSEPDHIFMRDPEGNEFCVL